MTANSASQSPNRLTICAYQTRRMTSMRSTSRNDIAAGGDAVAVVAVAMSSQLYVGAGQRERQLAVGVAQQPRDAIPVGAGGLRITHRRGLRPQQRRCADRLGRRLVEQRVLLGDQTADL